jgi:hypothetical protein
MDGFFFHGFHDLSIAKFITPKSISQMEKEAEIIREGQRKVGQRHVIIWSE